MIKPAVIFYSGILFLALGLSIAIGSIAPGFMIFGIGLVIHALLAHVERFLTQSY